MMDTEERGECMNSLESEFNGLMNCADREVSNGSSDIALGYYRAALELAACGIRGDRHVARGVRWAIGRAGAEAAIIHLEPRRCCGGMLLQALAERDIALESDIKREE